MNCKIEFGIWNYCWNRIHLTIIIRQELLLHCQCMIPYNVGIVPSLHVFWNFPVATGRHVICFLLISAL